MGSQSPHRKRTLKYPPNRPYMLSDRITEERRRSVITERANYLVEYDRALFPLGFPEEEWPLRGWQGRQYPWDPQRLYEKFEGWARHWRDSDDRQELVTVFSRLALEGRLPNIERIVTFGNGPPGGFGPGFGYIPQPGEHPDERYGDDIMANERSCLQFAAARDLARLISTLTHGREIDIWVQEPYLTRTDIQVLEWFGVRTANPFTQEGYTLINRDTFVMGIFVNFDGQLEAMTLECGRPGLIMWTDNTNQKAREHPARAAALEILAKEYDAVGPIKALTVWESKTKPPTESDGSSTISSSSHISSSAPSTSDGSGATTESFAMVRPDDPPLARATLYVPKAQFIRPPIRATAVSTRADSNRSTASSSTEGEPLWEVGRLVAMRDIPPKREYLVEWADADAGHTPGGHVPKGQRWLRDTYFRNQPWFISDFHARNPNIARPLPVLERWQAEQFSRNHSALGVGKKRRADEAAVNDDADNDAHVRKKRSITPSSSNHDSSDKPSPPKKRKQAAASKRRARK